MSNMYRNRDGLVVNMFDCTACPKCKSPFRYPFPQESPDCRCDDCGYVEMWSAINGKPAPIRQSWAGEEKP